MIIFSDDNIKEKEKQSMWHVRMMIKLERKKINIKQSECESKQFAKHNRRDKLLYCIFVYSQAWVTISLCNTFMQNVRVETSEQDTNKIKIAQTNTRNISQLHLCCMF